MSCQWLNIVGCEERWWWTIWEFLDDFLSLLAQCLFSSMMLVHFVVLACFVSVFELVFVLRCFVWVLGCVLLFFFFEGNHVIIDTRVLLYKTVRCIVYLNEILLQISVSFQPYACICVVEDRFIVFVHIYPYSIVHNSRVCLITSWEHDWLNGN